MTSDTLLVVTLYRIQSPGIISRRFTGGRHIITILENPLEDRVPLGLIPFRHLGRGIQENPAESLSSFSRLLGGRKPCRWGWGQEISTGNGFVWLQMFVTAVWI